MRNLYKDSFKEQDVFWEYKTIVFTNASDDHFDVSPWIDQSPVLVSCHASMEMVLELFIRLGIKTVCVVDKGVYIGCVYKKRLLEALNKE